MKALLIVISKWAQPTPNFARFNFCDRSKLGVSGPKSLEMSQNWPKWQIFLCKIHFLENLPKDSTAYHLNQ